MDTRLFVISDIHAFDGAASKDPRPSHYDLSLSLGNGDNPIEHLKTFISTSKVVADKLVCCGDLADKAYPSAVARAWAELQELKMLLKADEIIASVGNHDVDSRHHYNDHDARGVLLELRPPFPLADREQNNHFWTHHFSVLSSSSHVRYVTLNSSGFHGEGGEHEHGRVAPRTLARLRTALQEVGWKGLNVLICHHHPQKMDELKLGDYDDMKGGSDLLRLLDAVDFGPWLVIHGHKHFPKLTYAMGNSASPTVFSAGSCAAVLYPDIVRHAGNQVYLITLKGSAEVTTSCTGEFRAWDWAPGVGWSDASANSGLPSRGGFGFRGNLAEVANKIANMFPSGGKWTQVEAAVTETRYLIPADLKAVVKVLAVHHGFRIEEGKHGIPTIIER